jgi:predicted ATPase
VVVLDDLHLAEPTLLDLIEQVAALARQAPILLVAVARVDLLEQRRHWGGGMPNGSTLMLEPLDSNESLTLLGDLAGQGTLPPEVRRHIAETAEGNPLFLEEIVGMLIEERHLRRQGGGWVVSDLATWTLTTPPTIHAILAARLDRLEAEERAVLERASVIGQAFDPAAVVALSPEPTRADVRVHLLALVRKELLRPAEGPLGGWDGFQFHHLLMRDVAHDSIPKQTRAELHERYAGWPGETVGARGREYEEILGYHLERADRFLAELGPVDAHGQELAARAVSLLASAGRRAIGRGDVPASINLLDRAVALLPADDPARSHLLTQLAEALGLDASFDRAGRLLDEALAAAATGDEGLRAHATLGQLNLRLDAAPARSAPGRRPFRDEAQSGLETLERLGDEQGQFQRAIEHARACNDERLEARPAATSSPRRPSGARRRSPTGSAAARTSGTRPVATTGWRWPPCTPWPGCTPCRAGSNWPEIWAMPAARSPRSSECSLEAPRQTLPQPSPLMCPGGQVSSFARGCVPRASRPSRGAHGRGVLSSRP